MEECPGCGKRYAKFPWKDEQGKIIWKNMFKMDIVHLIFLIAILLMTYGYVTETAQCKEVIEQPCEFCAKSNCCSYISDGKFQPPSQVCGTNLNPDFVDLPQIETPLE